MPLFTALAAAATSLTGNAEVGGEVVAILSGALAVGALTWIGWRWLHPATGLLAGLLFVFQPDAALHAATPLRISTFVLFCLCGIALVGERRALLGSIVLSLGFLTRFELAFTLLPALAILAVVTRRARVAAGAGLLAATVAAWSIYYRIAEGSFVFWGDVMTRTAGEDTLLHPQTLWGVLTGMLPDHLGHVVVLAAPFGLWLIARPGGAGAEQRRWLALCGVSVFSFFCLTVTLSSYAADHNLFWKWSIASAPFVLLAGSHALVLLGGRVVSRLREDDALAARIVLPAVLGAALLAASIGLDYRQVTGEQLERSDRWYGTQVRLMEWIEASYPADVGIVTDNIPATWLSRIPNERRVLRWSSEQVPSLDQAAFGAWLLEQRIALVFSFAENNRGSLTKAPWLGTLRPVIAGPAQLQPIAREDGYGFIAWQVRGDGTLSHPTNLPPADAGGVQVVLEEEPPPVQ